MKTASILICALNEEASIGNLLDSLKNQVNCGEYNIKKILVVSDGSVDKTNLVVQSRRAFDPRIVLIENESRKGKINSLVDTFRELNEDVIVSLDADISVHQDAITNLLSNFSNEKAILVGGNPVPAEIAKTSTVAEKAGMFSWYLLNAIKATNPKSIYSAHGRILGLKRELYKRIVTPKTSIGTDQLMYIVAKGSFIYKHNAVVYYTLPRTIADYVKQNKRFRRAKYEHGIEFNDANSFFQIESKAKVLFKTFIQHPLSGLAWSFLYVYGKISFYLEMKNKQGLDSIWSEVKSTKV